MAKLVWSSEPPKRAAAAAAPASAPPDKQAIRLRIEKAGRGGKTVTVADGFLGARDDAAAMQYLIPNWTFDPKRPCLVR